MDNIQVLTEIGLSQRITHNMTGYLFGIGFGLYDDRLKKVQIHLL
jgi:hypothetical protein